jgi:ABC-type sugar transport system ATPase subunit
MLRLICGLERPDSGSILLAGRDITRAPSRERNIGMVFQDYGLYPHMNVRQNISYGLEARGMRRDEIDKRVAVAAEKLGLTPFLPNIIVDLSGGEQQRVALARAIAKDADLYLFDEPLSNLDPKLRSQARHDILMVHREKHKPTVYVTHDQTEALAIGDRIGVIARGKLQQVGTADDLLKNPANTFIAGFIGTPAMNLVRGKIMNVSKLPSEYNAFAFVSEGLTIPVSNNVNRALSAYENKEIVLGIRPTGIALIGQPRTYSIAPEMRVAVDVVDVIPLIGEIVVNMKVGSIELAAVFQEIDERIGPGDKVTIGIDNTDFRFFDPETEQAIPLES